MAAAMADGRRAGARRPVTRRGALAVAGAILVACTLAGCSADDGSSALGSGNLRGQLEALLERCAALEEEADLSCVALDAEGDPAAAFDAEGVQDQGLVDDAAAICDAIAEADPEAMADLRPVRVVTSVIFGERPGIGCSGDTVTVEVILGSELAPEAWCADVESVPCEENEDGSRQYDIAKDTVVSRGRIWPNRDAIYVGVSPPGTDRFATTPDPDATARRDVVLLTVIDAFDLGRTDPDD
jgi:hypothetical protein